MLTSDTFGAFHASPRRSAHVARSETERSLLSLVEFAAAWQAPIGAIAYSATPFGVQDGLDARVVGVVGVGRQGAGVQRPISWAEVDRALHSSAGPNGGGGAEMVLIKCRALAAKNSFLTPIPLPPLSIDFLFEQSSSLRLRIPSHISHPPPCLHPPPSSRSPTSVSRRSVVVRLSWPRMRCRVSSRRVRSTLPTSRWPVPALLAACT